MPPPKGTASPVDGTAMISVWFFWTWALTITMYSILLALWVVVPLCLGVYVCQDFLLYQPTYQGRHGEKRYLPYNVRGLRAPSEMGLPYENVYLTTSDGVEIHGWLLPQEESVSHPTILYFHGNAGNIGHRLPGIKDMYLYLRCNIFIVDYRGYGNSDGSPSESGLTRDAEAALDWVYAHQKLDSNRVIVFGRSLGGAVAVALSELHQDRMKGLILENTFTGIPQMALVLAQKFGFKNARVLWPILWFYVSNPWRSIERIKRLRLPILFVSGLKDELIPPAHMRELYSNAHASTHRVWHEVPEGQHNNTFEKGGSTYVELLLKFVASCCGENNAA